MLCLISYIQTPALKILIYLIQYLSNLLAVIDAHIIPAGKIFLVHSKYPPSQHVDYIDSVFTINYIGCK